MRLAAGLILYPQGIGILTILPTTSLSRLGIFMSFPIPYDVILLILLLVPIDL